MLNILHIDLPSKSDSERVYLSGLLNSARWLGWEMPGQKKPGSVPSSASSEKAGHFSPGPVHGKPA